MYNKDRITGYNCFPGSGWRAYGRLVVNFHNERIVSVYFCGERILDATEVPTHAGPRSLAVEAFGRRRRGYSLR